MIDFLLCLLIVQGVLGGVDTLLNHEWIARLPHQLSAREELRWHFMREANYAFLFAGFAWYEWHGGFALGIGAVMLFEVVVTASDEYIENRSRTLPHNERVMHVFLTMNMGLIVAAMVLVLNDWVRQDARLIATDYGMQSWILSALALTALAWSIRDFVAWRRLGRIQNREMKGVKT